MSILTSIVTRGVVAVASVCAASGPSDPRAPGLDEAPAFKGMAARWSGLMDEFDVPGMAIVIVKDGDILGLETFGVRSPAGPDGGGGASTPDTIYYIASITKTYLATAICALADEGKLSLDDPVKKHLPRLSMKRKGAEITIRDLLSHQAGIGNGGEIVALDAFTGEITEDRYYWWLAKLKPSGSVEYSNVHFTLLGRIIEAVTGKSWREYLAERVFEPAGLKRTTGYASRMYGDPECAMPMERVGETWRVCELRKTDRTMHAAGGLGTSATDAARWLLLHLNDGEIGGKRLISAKRAREMRQLQSRLKKKEGSIRIMEGFGLGWQVGTFHGTPLCSHGGGYAGTSAYYAILPEQHCGFAILMNSGGAAKGLQDVIAVDILDRLIEGDARVDVLKVYQKELGEQKKRFAAQMAKRKAEMSKPFKLSGPVGAYGGRYECAQLGTISIAPEGDRLGVMMGECKLDVAAAGSDAFRVIGPTLDGAVLTFQRSKQGEVRALSLDDGEQGTFVFKRTGERLSIGKDDFP